jgi:DNA-directed RNA polymerase subunit RPC12/RpoP
MRCPHCRNRLLQKSGTSTRLRVKGAVEFGADGTAKAQCYWCNQRVDLPVRLEKSAVDEETFLLTQKAGA